MTPGRRQVLCVFWGSAVGLSLVSLAPSAVALPALPSLLGSSAIFKIYSQASTSPSNVAGGLRDLVRNLVVEVDVVSIASLVSGSSTGIGRCAPPFICCRNSDVKKTMWISLIIQDRTIKSKVK